MANRARAARPTPSAASPPLPVRPGASEVERLCGDASRARALLGWAPEVSLDEGVARGVDYVRANLGRYQPEVYAV
jgi:nucleoside-diphosphate-sugar epimerase